MKCRARLIFDLFLAILTTEERGRCKQDPGLGRLRLHTKARQRRRRQRKVDPRRKKISSQSKSEQNFKDRNSSRRIYIIQKLDIDHILFNTDSYFMGKHAKYTKYKMQVWDILRLAAEAATSSRGHSIIQEVSVWSYVWYLLITLWKFLTSPWTRSLFQSAQLC